ncbi:MAG TPA: SPOR domain-containing protein, partial [Candidatus Binatia bacterium]|nr:SPOR domain-containing protein [Candidatus Binatia bacterium]
MPQSKSSEKPQAHSPGEKPLGPLEAATPKPTKVVAEPLAAPKPEANVPMTASLPGEPREAPEQLALLRKPSETVPEKSLQAQPAPKPLEGFIIQIAFSDKAKAQNWAEQMQQRGYAVSITEAGGAGSLRVRLGNFVVRDDAERQLRTLRQEGMSGIIINLPQAFRPEARSSVP